MAASSFRAAVAGVIAFLASDVLAQDAESAYTTLGCGACHSGEGRGGALGPNIATGDLTAAEFVDYVRSPNGTMPAYNVESVSDQSLAEIHAYLGTVSGTAQPTGDAERGATLYLQTGCYQCHANEGQGGAQGPRVGPDPLTLARFTWYIRNPSGSMPPYTDTVMTDQDVADIHAYLESLPQPVPVDDIPLLAP